MVLPPCIPNVSFQCWCVCKGMIKDLATQWPGRKPIIVSLPPRVDEKPLQDLFGMTESFYRPARLPGAAVGLGQNRFGVSGVCSCGHPRHDVLYAALERSWRLHLD